MLPGMTADGLTVALEDYQRAQDELVEARNRLARAIVGAAMSGMTLVLWVLQDASVSEDGAH
jgi:hypothetical protein